MKKPEEFTAELGSRDVRVCYMDEAEEYWEKLESALEEAVELMRDAAEFLAPYGTSVAADLRAFLDKHAEEDQ